MTTGLFIRIRGIIEQLGCTWLIKNDDAGIIHVKNESTRTIFKDADEILYSLAVAPPDYLGRGENRQFVVTAMEYDRIKTLEIDFSIAALNSFLVTIGENPEDYKDFIDSLSVPPVKTEEPHKVDMSENKLDLS